MIVHEQRIPFCDLSQLDEKDREMADRAKVDGEVLNIFKTLLNHPKLVRAWGRFGNHILGGSTLSARERELAILRIGWLNQAIYEGEQHVRIEKAAEIPDAEVEQIKAGPKAGWSRHEAAIIQAADD